MTRIRSLQPVALLFLITGLVAALLAGCSTPPSNSTESEPGAVRTVIDAEGTEVQVPDVPERIVTLSEPTLDGVLALGVVPVGTVTGRGQSAVPNYLADLAAEIPILGSVAQPNFEAIGQVAPDLILVDGTSINNNPPVIAALREIAPVVYTGFAGGDWRLNFELVAEALGLEDEGAAVIQAYDDRATELQDELSKYEESTFSIVRWQGGSAALILNELPPGVALLDLGLARPESQDRIGRGHSEPVSLENLQAIDADYIFFGTLGGSSVDNPNAGGSADISGAEDALDNAISTPGFTSLNAYQNDQIILVDGSSWTSTGGPILMHSLIEDVAEALL